MLLQLESFSYDNQEWFAKSLAIRTEVFVQEQKVDKNLEFDGLDFTASHYLLLCNGEPAACARSRETKEGIKLERFAVPKPFRGKAFGLLLLKYVLEDVLPSNKLLYLHAQDVAIDFYGKHGFAEVGDRFTEANIEHVRMEYRPQGR